MASFSAYLEVGGNRYPLTYYDLFIHQQTDMLGRPASLTQGGTITVELHSPPQTDTVLIVWMLSPTKQHDGFVHLYREDTKAKFKTISFFNAYCVDMGTVRRCGAFLGHRVGTHADDHRHFPSAGGCWGGSA
ncbi:type VI secretion system tube protein TssD [Fibrella aquatilis]|uniref:Uncharacterized protein n=1 Tax=Fibrella aquatilis TaxID=2817059 RepID=A0A939JZS8_9BACT|nr:type VI secretion system tube protein TssD [Fibrella aquatilis]MBO0931733.1 hypothetical protein [Fibrella aquatilis]